MLRVRALGAVVVLGSLLGLTGCTGDPPRQAPSPAVSSALPVPTTALPSPTAIGPETPEGPKLPAVRWDKVRRGPLPSGCATIGATRAHVVGATVYATGPSLACPAGRAYWVRAVVKLAEYRGRGRWVYVTPAKPSAPQRNRADAQRSSLHACRPGTRVRAVASFVLTWPDGHQVRYRRLGTPVRCG